jgi:hypothetical protein
MPKAGSDLQSILLSIAQSMTNVGYRNPQFVDFVKYLLSGRSIISSFISAETPPGAVSLTLDISILCGGPMGGGSSLVTITARRTGLVEWGVTNLRLCAGIAATGTSGGIVGVISFGSAGNTQIATRQDDEVPLNEFLLEVARAAGF